MRFSTVDLIITSAVRIFARFGYESATISGIAADAGLSHQTVRNHFHTKRRLFAEVVRLGWQKVFLVLAQRISERSGTKEKLMEMFAVWLEIRRDDQGLLDVLIPALWLPKCPPNERQPEAYWAFVRLVLDVIRQGQRNSEFAVGMSAEAAFDLATGPMMWVVSRHLVRASSQARRVPSYSETDATLAYQAMLHGLERHPTAGIEVTRRRIKVERKKRPSPTNGRARVTPTKKNTGRINDADGA